MRDLAPSSVARGSSWVSTAFFINSPETCEASSFQSRPSTELFRSRLNKVPQIEVKPITVVLKLIVDDQHERSVGGRRDVHAPPP